MAKAIDIAEKVILESKLLDEKTKTHFINWGREAKHDALHPEPRFKNISSLKYIENDFLVYWNESNGKDVEKFWKEVFRKKIGFQRKDIIGLILKRKKIKDVHEYDNLIDTIVVAEQIGQIDKAQVKELNRYIGEFEERQI